MLSLTRQEQQVILFLITVALLGMGVNFLVKRNSHVLPSARASFPAGFTPLETIHHGFLAAAYGSLSLTGLAENNIGKVNLNQADKKDLMGIPGLGEKLALRILEYRQQNGDFASLEDLRKIKGINANRYEKLRNLSYIE